MTEAKEFFDKMRGNPILGPAGQIHLDLVARETIRDTARKQWTQGVLPGLIKHSTSPLVALRGQADILEYICALTLS